MIWDRLREKIIYLIPRWQPPQQLLRCFATRAPASGWRWRWSYAPRVMRLWWPYLVCRPQRGAGGRTSPCRSKKKLISIQNCVQKNPPMHWQFCSMNMRSPVNDGPLACEWQPTNIDLKCQERAEQHHAVWPRTGFCQHVHQALAKW